VSEIRNNNNGAQKLLKFDSVARKQTCSTFKWINQTYLIVKKSRRWYSKFQEKRVWTES
jgi:hypothetical protein